jgi:CheY-like chemotaxis protein
MLGGEGGREPRDLLPMLEEHVRVEFHPLVTRPDFVALARGLRDDGEWDVLRAAFARGALSQVAPIEVTRDEPRWKRVGFYGQRVLWVDDRMENNSTLVESLLDGGAEVRFASGFKEMVAELDVGPAGVLISDVDREGDPEAGFDDLRKLRADGELELPNRVIFFTGRVTPARFEEAEALDAVITSDPDKLLNFIAASPRDER